MPAERRLQPRWAAPLRWLAVCLALWLLAAGLEWKAGAFATEFGSHPDESAHYITGLMIRDYLAGGHYGAPLAYAEHYYAHYPKVALGMWPPLFHITEALWMLVFSPAKVSVLLLMALIAAATGASIYGALRASVPAPAAFAGGALFVLLPLTQASTWTVMADGLVTLMSFWAMIHLARYFEAERTRDAVIFGVFAALSMSTKANGVALAVMPLVLLLLTRRFPLLRARGLYYAAAIALVFGLPWQVISYRLIQRSAGVEQPGLEEIVRTAMYYVRVVGGALGWGLAPFCVLGIGVFLAALWRGRTDFSLAAALALLVSVWTYHSSIGNGEPRYMLSALPPALLFTISGFVWLARRMPRWGGVTLGGVAAAVFVTQTWAVPLKPYQGVDQAAHYLLTTPEFADGDFLVVSNARGEGAFISEVAMHDERPGHIVLRSTKVLVSTTWYATLYKLRYKTAPEIRDFLDHAPIQAVLLDTRPSQIAQDEAPARLAVAVGEVLRSDSNWNCRVRFPRSGHAAPWMELYTRVGPQPSGEIRLDLRYTLGKDIVHTNCKRAK
jgi:hypothetical protein